MGENRQGIRRESRVGAEVQVELEGKIALVTGAAGVLGKAFCRALSLAGADVALIDNSETALAGATTELTAAVPGRRFIGIACDVRVPREVRAAVAKTKAEFGRIDILVNSAGGSLRTPKALQDVTEEHWDLVLDVNLKGTFLMCQAVAPVMQEHGGGKIINIASIAGRLPSVLTGVQYAASKGGVTALTRKLAAELGPSVTVNAIAPGVALAGERVVGMWNNLAASEREETLSAIPLRRLSTPEDQADVVVFLAGPGSRYITGATIDVNGGRFMG
jgi:NAD(P)-dependent dehydrogenase (short-subunit alcohol dehydrogenase family)